jgi:hypothetical protein
LLAIYRYYNPNGTVGHLKGKGFECWTIERPWVNNEPFKSCVQEGEYGLVPHKSEKYGRTYALVNRDLGVTHQQEPGSKRYACLLHTANYPEDVEGCIGPGERHIIHDNRLMVTSSRTVLGKLLEYIEKNNIRKILITGFTP